MLQRRTKTRRRIAAAVIWIASWLLMGSISVAAPVHGTMRSSQEASTQQELSLYARAAVLLDGDSGRVLYGKEEDVILPMASTTKVMTCILALEQASEELICEFSSRAAAAPRVKLGAPAGSQFYLRELLYSLMLESHNDTAIAIAEAVSGSVEDFAESMNQKAKELGLSHTHFVTPNGLDAEEHYTTARELALLLRYCIQESPKAKEFLSITQTESYQLQSLDGTRSYHAVNHNAFLNMMEGALTGKTGFTGKAGYCYVGALKRGDTLLIVALLGCGWPNNRSYKWSDTRQLMNYGLEEFTRVNLIRRQIRLPSLVVEQGVYDYWGMKMEAELSLRCEQPEEFWVLLGKGEEVTMEKELPAAWTAPGREGERVGTLRYELDGEVLLECPIFAAETVEKREFSWYLQQVWKKFLSLQEKEN